MRSQRAKQRRRPSRRPGLAPRLHRLLSGRDGPLPWLPGIPNRIAADPTWGPYFGARSRLVAQLADQVRLTAEGDGRADRARATVPAELIADVQVWRAATQVDPSDLRLTGPAHLGRAARIFQQQLESRLAAVATEEDWRWRQLLAAEAASTTADPFLPELTEGLSHLTRAGLDATILVRSAAAEGPLPDDHPAAALWRRVLDQLSPQMPNRDRNALPTTSRTTTTSPGHQRPVPRSAPPSFAALRPPVHKDLTVVRPHEEANRCAAIDQLGRVLHHLADRGGVPERAVAVCLHNHAVIDEVRVACVPFELAHACPNHIDDHIERPV
jgi:hypothetical protein